MTTIPDEAVEAAAACIPDAAIEAAAQAIDDGFQETGYYYNGLIARAAIEAAMPALREAIAAEIEADAGISTHPWLNGIKRAALIVRSKFP